jgi:hypothetical protein
LMRPCADANRRFLSPNPCGTASRLHALRARARQAARVDSEASPADHRCRERKFQRAAAHGGFDRVWRSHARSEMACAGGHTSGRRRQGSEILSHIGDDRTPRTCHRPCGARAAGKRRHAEADESRNSPRSWKDTTWIADELGIQLSSVADLTRRLYQTLDVHNSAELATKIWLSQKQGAARKSLRLAG